MDLALRLERLEDRHLFAAIPAISGVGGTTGVLLGESVSLGFNFQNGSTTDTGFSPFLEIAVDTSGPDGATSLPLDGIGTIAVTSTGLPLTPIGTVTLVAGQTTWTNPFTSQTRPVPAGFGARDTIYVYALPFGSFTPNQITAVTVSASTSNFADVGTAMPISIVPGFRDTDAVAPIAPIYGSESRTDVVPEFYRVTKSYVGPESETATGPNFVRRYRLEVDIPTGQTLTNLRVFDTLASSMQIVGRNTTVVAGEPNMAAYVYATAGSPGANVFSLANLTGTAVTTTPGGTLDYSFGTKTGVSGVDAAFEFNFYVPRDHANPPGGQVLPQTASSGTDSVNATNVANSSADWDPLDPRDPVTQVFAPGPGSAAVVSHTLEEQSIAVQKSVEAINPATGEADASIVPGKTLLRYTVNFQVSDYYAFENVILRDVMSDGQRLFIGTRDAVDAFPTMSVNNAFVTGSPAGSRVNTSGIFEGAGVIDYQRRYSTDHPLANPTSFPVDGPATGTIRPNVFTNLTPAPDTNVDDGGRTFLQFNISDELKARLGANAGRLVGGEISNGGIGPQNSPYGSQLFSGTTGTIVFYAEVCEEFSDAHPSNDTSVDQGDRMNNFVDDPLTGARDGITGSQLNPATINAATPTVIGTGSDDSGTTIQIGYGTIEKQIYAVNGQVLPSQGSFADPITVQASDRVTYRLTYTLPLSSFEDLRLIDIPPLPVMDVDDATFTFTRNPAAYAFGAGEIGVLDPTGSGTLDDTYFATFDPTLAGVRNPVISKNSTDNTVTMNFGTHEDIPLRRASQISLLITFPVSNDPFITDLFLTNQFRVTEASTNAGDTTAEGIRQIELVRPTVEIQKGAVAGDTIGLSSGNIAFAAATNATGTLTIGGAPLSAFNTLNSAAQATAIGGLNINATNAPVDAGDIVRYAIVAQNTGQGDAFDVQIRDQIQAGYAIPATFAGLNFRGFRGDGTPLVNGVDYNVVSYNNTTGEFLIELVDNYTAGNLGGAAEDARPGALSRAASATLGTITNGSNGVIFLYDLTLTGTIAPNTSITNTATVPKYSNSEGGPDVTDPNEVPGATDPTNNATVVTDRPAMTKVLTGTEFNYVGNNLANQATIGEIVTYTVTMTVPEGVMNTAQIADTMAEGLAFVRLVSVTSSDPTDLTFTNAFGTLPAASPSNVSVANSGRNVTFNFGTMTNADRDNTVNETITLVYEAIVVNVPVNQAGQTRTNSAQLSWQNNATTVAAAAASNVTIVEPTLTTGKHVRNVTRSGSFAATTSGDNQDVMEYQITITNGDATGDTTAFDVTFSDVIPAMITSPSIASVTSTGGISINGVVGTVGTSDLSLSGNTLTFSRNIDMPRNSSITILIQGTFAGGTGLVVDNTADVRWTSLDGDITNRSIHNPNSSERTGAGGTNDYQSQGTATIASPPLVYKGIVSTSEAASTGSQALIGEIVRYRLVTMIGEGTSRVVVLQDSLPNGLRFLNDGTARYAFVTSGGSDISSISVTDVVGLGTAGGLSGSEATITTLASSAIVGTFGDSNIATGFVGVGTGDATVYNSGQDVFFRFGNLVNSDNDLDNEYVVVEFNVLVSNQIENQAGVSRVNTYTVLADTNGDGVPGYVSVTVDTNGNGVRDTGENTTTASDPDNNAGTTPNTTANSNAATVIVAEPSMSLAKQVIATTGGIVTYRVTVTNASGANLSNAYDTRVLDILDGVNLSLRAGSVSAVTLTGGASGATDGSSGNTVDVTVAVMPPGSTASFTYEANVLTVPTAGSTWDNTARSTFTSLPGGSGTGGSWTGTAGTSSAVPGAAGSATGERNGVDGFGQLNDYVVADTERLGSLGDRVWVDLNNNGVQDTGEPGIVGAPVSVRWAGPNGTFGDGDDSVASVVTGPDGAYVVTGLPVDSPGAFRVSVDTTASVFTTNNLTTQTFDADGLATANVSQVSITSVTPNPRNQDFGYRGPGTIGDTVFLDVDNDGVADSGEGIANVTVRLTGDFDGDGITETVSAVTDTNGFYQFSGLRVTTAGVAYTVIVDSTTLPAGVSQTFDPDPTLDHQATATLTVAAPSNQTRDFGYRGPGSIGDTIFLDINNNGVADAGEGISGVAVNLTGDLDGDGSPETVTAVTDASGNYLFGGLRTTLAGVTYTVDVVAATLPAGVSQTFDPDGTINGQSTATLTNAVAEDLSRDFGYRGPGSIGDTIFLDINGNNAPNTGEGIAGVTVQLSGDFDGDGVAETVTTTTDTNGSYLFSGLPVSVAGIAYTVSVVTATLPAGAGQTYDPDGTLDHQSVSTLTVAAPTDLTRDFGYRASGSIGDMIFLDVNNNGVVDPGEGITGVTVQLVGDIDGDGTNETITTTTGPDGTYGFGGLPTSPSGKTYTVIVDSTTLPPGLSQSFDPDGVTNHQSTATLTDAAPANMTRDFGYRGLGSIGDTIFLDINGNGVPEPGEGIAGVTVTLTGDLDGDGVNETVTTTTDASGVYGFGGLRTTGGGVSYTVAVDAATLPAGLSQTFDPDGTINGQSTATLTNAAPSNLTRDFGYRGPADLRLTKSNGATMLFPTLPTTYTIEVFNDGPFPMSGATVTDVLPAGLTYVSGSQGVTYNPTTRTVTYVTGQINVNSSTTFTITATVDPTAPLTIRNTATVTPPSGITDPDPTDNTGTDEDQVIYEADLSITKSNGSGVYQEGGTAVYTIVVTNNSEFPVFDVRVQDPLPAGVVSATWTAIFSTGSSGTASGSGAINQLVSLSAGGSAIYTFTAVIGQSTSGKLVNTATVTPPTWLTDPDPTNNSATDIDKLPIVVTGTEVGCTSSPMITVIDPYTNTVRRQFSLFESAYRGGVRVSVGDVDGDGVDEIIAAPGAGRVGEVRVFKQDGTELTAYRTFPFGPSYRNGVEIAVGDIDGDGDDDIVAAASRGPGDVRVFQVNPGAADPVADTPIKSFRAFAASFQGGATVAVADLGTYSGGTTVDSNVPDGKMEIVVGSGAGMRATVQNYDVSGTPRLIDTLLPLPSTFRNGVSVSSARVNGDAIDDIIVSSGRGGSTVRETFDGRISPATNALLHRDAVFADIGSTTAPLFTAPIDLDGDHIADKFFHTLGDQGNKAYPGVRSTDPAGAGDQTIGQLNFSQRIAASRVSRTQPIQTTASGLMIQDVRVGDGAIPAVTQLVTIHFVATTPNGSVVRNTRETLQPLSFRLDSTTVMPGLREAIQSMRVGGTRRVIVPPSLQTGSVPSGLPTGNELVFEIELISATN
jgi:fimbrial isopeptide formation D2 family protein/uncharacterized repeat protein (TIGR01451 family)